MKQSRIPPPGQRKSLAEMAGQANKFPANACPKCGAVRIDPAARVCRNPTCRQPLPPARPRLGDLDLQCPKCGGQMIARSSREAFTYYYCNTDGCDYSKKVPRPSFTTVVKDQDQ